jgi:DNA polymerase-3 subunit alpha
MAFVHLHNHTEHSTLDGATRIKSAAKIAAALGQNAMAVTDHGPLAAAWKFTKACKEAGIKPIIGVEFYMSIGSRFERNSIVVDSNDESFGDADEGAGKEKVKRYEHLTVLARTQQGWKNLLALHNKAEESYWYKPRIDYALLKEHGEGLIVLTGCLAGPVAGPLSRAAAEDAKGDTTAADGFRAEARKNLDTLIDCVGKDYVFLEIMDHGIGAEKSVLGPIKDLSTEYGIPMVVTNDCHYQHEDDAAIHDGFLAVGVGRNLDDPTRFRFNGSGYHIKSEEEMRAIRPNSKAWQDAVSQTQIIADLCEDQVIPQPHMRLPKYPLPEGFEDSNVYLHTLVKEGSIKRYGFDKDTGERIKLSDEVKERLRSELDIIKQMGFPDYFLIVWDVINWCRSDAPIEFDNPDAPRKKPILVGPGRGSAAGSAVSYCLGIVGIDPLYNHLLFERFLEPGRAGMPDIDVDFEKGRRDEVFAYLGYRWGKGNVARIGTFGVALAKAAIKDAARILKPTGASPEAKAAADEMFKAGRKAEGAAILKEAHKAAEERGGHMLRLGNKMSDLVPDAGEKTYDFDKLADTKDLAGQAFRELVEAEGQDALDILELARGFEGLTKNESIHACGFVVSPEPLDELVPLRWSSHAADADPAAPRVICWDGPEVEDYGFLKMDVLGLMNLDIVSTALENIELTTGEVITMDGIPHPDTKGDDKVDAAFALIAAGNTAGVFQMESPGMIKIAQDVVPDSLTDISAIVALFRPGPLAAKVPDRYAARKNGLEEVDYDQFTSNPLEQEWIAKVLGDTYGVFVFQESLMRLGTVISGFDASQRSVLRKAVGKKDAKKMAEVGEMLAAGAEQEFFDEDGNMISPKFSAKTAAHMFELMKGSASYLFNASHSAAYAHLAYVTAYLKANWPVEYGAAILSVVDTNKPDKRLTALQSLHDDGITVLAPDVNLARARSAPVNGCVFIGLAEIRDVGSAATHIVAEREKKGPFASLHDLMTRVTIPGKNGGYPTKLSSGAVVGLIEAGALDEFGSRLGLLMTARAAFKTDISPLNAKWSDVEESTRQRLRLGVSLGVHPLKSLRDKLLDWRAPMYDDEDDRSGAKLTPLHKIPDEHGRSTVTVGVISGWEEKGYSGGRRANFVLESPKLSLRGVMWDYSLSRLKRTGTVPRVGDVMAISGKVNVRMTTVGDEETGTEDTITTKELSANNMWAVESVSPPTIDLPGNVFDFQSAYDRLRAVEVEKPARKKAAPVAKTEEAPASQETEDEDPGQLAEVTDLNSRRKNRSRWAAVACKPRSKFVKGDVLAGDADLAHEEWRLAFPTKTNTAGTVLRCVLPNGDSLTVVMPTPSLTGEELLSSAQSVGNDSDRWAPVETGTDLVWFRLTAERASKVKTAA